MVTNMIGGIVKPVSKIEFWSLFSPPMQDELANKACDEGVVGFVCFENLQMDSSQFGKRSAVAFGPGCTSANPRDVVARFPRLGETPSQFQYPTCYCITKDES